MKLNFKIISTVDFPGVQRKVENAGKDAIKDLVVAIANTAIKEHPWKTRTGNNARSIKYEAKGLKGSVFSTSGYGGYLETGTRSMPAFPYFKPAMDKNIKKFPKDIKVKMEAPGL